MYRAERKVYNRYAVYVVLGDNTPSSGRQCGTVPICVGVVYSSIQCRTNTLPRLDYTAWPNNQEEAETPVLKVQEVEEV